jgi:hypothetical protein
MILQDQLLIADILLCCIAASLRFNQLLGCVSNAIQLGRHEHHATYLAFTELMALQGTPTLNELKLQYYRLYIQYYQQEHNYLEVPTP